jgi:threonyl-tRNA synthetase
MSLPERFDLSYKGQDNEKHRPIMIHRVIYGSLERFFGILVEHFAGRFPLWLAPVQVVLLPINQDLLAHAEAVKAELETYKIRCEVDKKNETLKKKIRAAQLDYVPLIITLGEKEKETGTLSVRTLDGKVRMGITMEEFVKPVLHHIKERTLDEAVF